MSRIGREGVKREWAVCLGKASYRGAANDKFTGIAKAISDFQKGRLAFESPLRTFCYIELHRLAPLQALETAGLDG